MISNPKYGDRVQCWYGPRSRDAMPYHGQCGSVVIVGTGRPRNHGVKFYNADGTSSTITVPAGNLRPEPAPAPDCPHRRVDRDKSGATVCTDCGEDISRG